MHPLLRYTLDLFESNTSPAPVNTESIAIKSVANKPYQPGATLEAVTQPARFQHPLANREARLGEALVGFQLKRGKRRTIGFSVGPDGLVVSAPQWMPLYQVDAALAEKSGWVLRKLAETRARHERLQANRIDWRDGASLPFLGQSVRLVLDPSHAFGAVGGALLPGHDGDPQLHLALPQAAAPEQIRDAVQAWMMRQAKTLFQERLDHFAPQLQVQWRKLSLSSAGTRWGSARADGSIRLHWRLVHFRLAVIDYVVVHELSHLRVMDHSPRFWETVRTVVPDYPSLRGQLKDEAIPRWV
jgi:predicted metal-dependent hydrolase